MLKDLLESKKCFKLICGAGNENLTEVRTLVELYYNAGCRFFDLSMSEEVIKVAKSVAPDAYFCVSTGIKGDPHMKKAMINHETCKRCEKCKTVCPQKAISQYLKVKSDLCIGCMRCYKACRHNAIEQYDVIKDLKDIMPQVLQHNPDCIELHAIGEDEKDVDEKWAYISENFKGMLSLCLDRSKLGNKQVLSRIMRLIKDREPYTTIIQADGAPMSGGEDDYKTTLQAVAMAEIIQDAKLPVYILLSGGTNSKTIDFARACGVDPDGVAIGSYARKIVKPFLDKGVYDKALEVAKKLLVCIR